MRISEPNVQPKLPKMYLDPQNPGIIRFEGYDETTGILAGVKAQAIVDVCNAHDDLLHELFSALPFLEDMRDDPAYKKDHVSTRIKSIRAALVKATKDAK